MKSLTKKKMLGIILVLALILSLSACKSTNSENKNDGRLQVIVSFNPLKEFTKAIGGDKVDVYVIIPDGMEPHDFEPKAKDLEALSKGKIFVYNGLEMESWAKKSIESVDNKNLIVVDSSKGVNRIKNVNEDEIKEHGQYDPHIWLSLLEAQIQCKNIEEALIKADSKNKDYYEKNYTEYTKSLQSLYEEYKDKFSKVPNKSFVTGHAAFAYFCRDFGLKQNSVEDVFAEGEPSAKKMKELVDYCKENSIKTIFTEDLVSSKVSETLADEVGAKAQKIHTIESGEKNKTYIDLMKENLEQVYESLK